MNVLIPVSGALLDGGFQDAVAHGAYQLSRIQDWLKSKTSTAAPQVLLVPAPKEDGTWPWGAHEVGK
jgi:hypothetical protein